MATTSAPRRVAPRGEGRGEAGRGVAHVVADDDLRARGAHLVDEPGTERLDGLLGESVAHDAADVVGLHDRVEARASLGGCCRIHALKPTPPSETCRTTCHPTGAEVRSAWRLQRS